MVQSYPKYSHYVQGWLCHFVMNLFISLLSSTIMCSLRVFILGLCLFSWHNFATLCPGLIMSLCYKFIYISALFHNYGLYTCLYFRTFVYFHGTILLHYVQGWLCHFVINLFISLLSSTIICCLRVFILGLLFIFMAQFCYIMSRADYVTLL